MAKLYISDETKLISKTYDHSHSPPHIEHIAQCSRAITQYNKKKSNGKIKIKLNPKFTHAWNILQIPLPE
jgi:hypothetical protein